ncbi:MAG: hypothetical protein KGJ13_02220 [Patescibacteria group bacterium]|nr:hypothetical protein [Patescibacteria group bacterium]
MNIANQPVRSAIISDIKSANYSQQAGDVVILFGNTAGMTLTLLPAARENGAILYVNNEGNENTLTIAVASTDTINETTSYTLAADSVICLVADAANNAWRLVSGPTAF